MFDTTNVIRIHSCESVINGTEEKGNVFIMFKSMSDLREKNKKIGHLFFDHDTMKFWGSKIETALFRGVFFITSEKGFSEKDPRTFSIRQAHSTGEITTVGKGREYKTLDDAKKAVKSLIRALKIKNVKRATTPRKEV